MLDFKTLCEGSPILITTPENRFYLTGFESSLGYLYLVGDRRVLYVDGRYFEAAQNGVKPNVEVRLLKGLGDAVAEMNRDFEIETLLCEGEISVREFKSLQSYYKCIDFEASIELSDALLLERSKKSEAEISCILTAQSFAEKAFDDILDFIRPGVTEREIAIRLEHQMLIYGSDGAAFETIAISGKNTSKPHGVPSNKPVEKGDFVTMDFGATYMGYHSDMTRTVAVGYATDEMERVYNTVLSAQNATLSALTSGLECSAADAVARDVITAAGYGENFTHSTGHGVGLEIHEFPNLSPSSSAKLCSNQVVTVEPGIYLPEKFGVRVEDMAKITPNSAENLTNSKKSLIILKNT